MTLRHLSIYRAVYETGSITLAAKQLHMTQPAVSLAVQELERHYGIHLFDRIGKRLHITETGRQFYTYADHITSLFQEMEDEMRDWDRNAGLHIGSSITIGSFYLPEIVRTFRSRFPDTPVHISVCNTGRLAEQVSDGRLDLALVEGAVSSAHLTRSPFHTDDLVLFCSPLYSFPAACYASGNPDTVPPSAANHLFTPEELFGADFILREKGSASRDLLDSLFLLQGKTLAPIWESNSNQSVLRAVLAGLGISALPSILIRDPLRTGEALLLNVEGFPLKREYSILTHKDKYLPYSAGEFIRLCMEWEYGEPS